jgi:hypothetical protein
MTVEGLMKNCDNHIWRQMLMVGVIGTFASGLVMAQQVGNPATLIVDEELEETPRFTVELIVFEYNDSSAADTELFAPDVVPIEDEYAAGYPLPASADEELAGTAEPLVFGDQTGEPEEALPAPFTGEELILNEVSTLKQSGLKVLDPSEYILNDVYEKLVELDAYKPLVRTAWTQETLEQEATTPIDLRRLGNSPLRLNGTVTLYLSRYLHLVVDLALDEKIAGSDPYSSTPYYGDNRNQSDYSLGQDQEALTGPVRFRIEEDRIVRNGELRYYDHPRFGVLAKITRVEVLEQEIGTMEPTIGGIDN